MSPETLLRNEQRGQSAFNDCAPSTLRHVVKKDARHVQALVSFILPVVVEKGERKAVLLQQSGLRSRYARPVRELAQSLKLQELPRMEHCSEGVKHSKRNQEPIGDALGCLGLTCRVLEIYAVPVLDWELLAHV